VLFLVAMGLTSRERKKKEKAVRKKQKRSRWENTTHTHTQQSENTQKQHDKDEEREIDFFIIKLLLSIISALLLLFICFSAIILFPKIYLLSPASWVLRAASLA
jgi:flagellar biosynthesis protein FliP